MNEQKEQNEQNKQEKIDPKVSIVILPYDNYEFFVRATESLHGNTDYSNFEIIVSHNPCKSEETNTQIKEFCEACTGRWDNFKYIVNETNLYHAKGNARGIEIADPESKSIVLANDDIFIPGNQLNWLTKLVKFAEADENVATVTPCLLYPKETIYWLGKQNAENPQHDFLHLPRGDERLPKEPLTTCYNNMACCLIRKTLLDEIELGVDTTPHYGSDSSFCNKVKELHPEMEHWVLPSIKVYHWNIYYLRTNRDDPIIDG